jgi:hypothetical protein
VNFSAKNTQNNRSPGLDGLTVEFYNFFWRDLGSLLIRALNQSFRKGQLSNYQRLGVITYLPKPGKPKEFIKELETYHIIKYRLQNIIWHHSK